MQSDDSDSKTSVGSSMKEFFLKEKPSDMIVILKQTDNSHASELCKIADTTYSHSVKVMNKMMDIGLVEAKKRGRKKEYTLTDKGEELGGCLLSIYKSIDGLEIPKKETDKKLDMGKIQS